MRQVLILFGVVLSMAGCEALLNFDGIQPPDAGVPDAGNADAAPLLDAGDAATEVDSGIDASTDSGVSDGSPLALDSGIDAGSDSGASVDAGSDAAPADAGFDAGVDAGLDAGVDAGSTSVADAGPDAGPDSGIDAGPTSGADAGADSGYDAGYDAGPITCTRQFGPTVASVSAVASGPTLAYRAAPIPLWGIAWPVGNVDILYNSIDNLGVIQNSTDVVVAPTVASTTYGVSPRLETVGVSLVLVYGVMNGTGTAPTYPEMALINAATGTVTGMATGGSVNDSVATEVGGVAVSDGGPLIVTASRQYSLGLQKPAAADLFSATPALVTQKSPSSTTRATSIGWADAVDLFGVAYVADATASGGLVTTYDSTLAFKTSYNFTDPVAGFAKPCVGLPGYQVSIAGAGANFAVGWVDCRSAESEIYLTSVNALGGTRVAAGEVAVNQNSSSKFYPRVAFDGRSVIVAWMEVVAGTYDVMVRRFDPATLASLEAAPLCVSCGAGANAQLSAIGLAVAGSNDYGTAFMLLSAPSNQQYFTHIKCSGP